MTDIFNDGSECFGFRITELPDGSQWIDDRLITPMDTLTPAMQVEYMEIYNQLGYMERMKRKDKRKQVQRGKSPSRLLYKVACICNLF